MNVHQRITDRPEAVRLAVLAQVVQLLLLDGAATNGVQILDTLDDLTEASIALRTTIANQLGA